MKKKAYAAKQSPKSNRKKSFHRASFDVALNLYRKDALIAVFDDIFLIFPAKS
jgi:hypothetical protein